MIKKGSTFGAMGVATFKMANQWMVTYSIDDNSRDYLFEENKLAALEVRR